MYLFKQISVEYGIKYITKKNLKIKIASKIFQNKKNAMDIKKVEL